MSDERKKQIRHGILIRQDRMLLAAHYADPERHRHLSKHLLISAEPFRCELADRIHVCRSIWIQSQVPHRIERLSDALVFVFFFDEVSATATAIDDQYLRGQDCAFLPPSQEKELLKILEEPDIDARLVELDSAIIRRLCLCKGELCALAPDMKRVVDKVRQSACIDDSFYETAPRMLYLSKSRFLHRFREETGMSFKRFLLFERIGRVHRAVMCGERVTDAALDAGFSSSAHFAAAYRQHFGISIRAFVRAQMKA